MLPVITNFLAWLNRVCGFETLDSFPPGHPNSRTRWKAAYFDIASDMKPDQIERSICDRIENTPLIFAQIENPTPKMQRMLLSVIETRMRRGGEVPGNLVQMLIDAYRSPHTMDVVPGLRSVIVNSQGDLEAVMHFLGTMPSASIVIEA